MPAKKTPAKRKPAAQRTKPEQSEKRPAPRAPALPQHKASTRPRVRLDPSTVERIEHAQEVDAVDFVPKLGRYDKDQELNEEHIPFLRVLYRYGATDAEVAQLLGVSRRQLYKWREEFPEFNAATELGKDEADNRVRRALYERAVGYSRRKTKVLFNARTNQIFHTVYEEFIEPDVNAAIFWLRNRDPENWRSDPKADDAMDALVEAVAVKVQDASNPERKRLKIKDED